MLEHCSDCSHASKLPIHPTSSRLRSLQINGRGAEGSFHANFGEAVIPDQSGGNGN